MKALEQCQSLLSSMFIVNCDHILNFVLNIDFEQANVCLVHVENTSHPEEKIRHIIYVML